MNRIQIQLNFHQIFRIFIAPLNQSNPKLSNGIKPILNEYQFDSIPIISYKCYKRAYESSYIHFIIIGITISDDEVDSESIVCLDQNTTSMVIELDSESKNESINEQDILKGLQGKIDKRYLNDSKVYIHNTDHNHDHLNSNDEEFEFEYICEIPFGNQVVSQNSNFSFLQSLPEIPITQDKLLEDRIQSLLSKYKSKKISEDHNVNEFVGKESMLSIPLKKRRIKL